MANDFVVRRIEDAQVNEFFPHEKNIEIEFFISARKITESGRITSYLNYSYGVAVVNNFKTAIIFELKTRRQDSQGFVIGENVSQDSTLSPHKTVHIEPGTKKRIWGGSFVNQEEATRFRIILIAIDGIQTRIDKTIFELFDLSRNSLPSQKCFIATAAFGTEQHEDVLYLRRFRDFYLQKNFFGRVLIFSYYIFSPRLAQFIITRPRIRSITRILLISIVKIIRLVTSLV